MQIEIPNLAPPQFGQMVLQIAAQAQVPGSVQMQMQMLSLHFLAQGLASGTLTIMGVTENVPDTK